MKQSKTNLSQEDLALMFDIAPSLAGRLKMFYKGGKQEILNPKWLGEMYFLHIDHHDYFKEGFYIKSDSPVPILVEVKDGVLFHTTVINLEDIIIPEIDYYG